MRQCKHDISDLVTAERLKEKTVSSADSEFFFVCELLGYVSRAVRPSADPTRSGQSKFVRKDKNIQFQWPDQRKKN